MQVVSYPSALTPGHHGLAHSMNHFLILLVWGEFISTGSAGSHVHRHRAYCGQEGTAGSRQAGRQAGRQDNKVLEIWKVTQQFSAGVCVGCWQEVDLIWSEPACCFYSPLSTVYSIGMLDSTRALFVLPGVTSSGARLPVTCSCTNCTLVPYALHWLPQQAVLCPARGPQAPMLHIHICNSGTQSFSLFHPGVL